MHIASFAGFAPVNNPVIAVAVVIDSPEGRVLRRRRSPRRSSLKWRSRFSSTSAFRTTSICGPHHRPRKRSRLSRKTTPRRRAKTFRPSTTPPTICPATIRCAPRAMRLPLRTRTSRRLPQTASSTAGPHPATRPSPPAQAPAQPAQSTAQPRSQCGGRRRRRATARAFAARPLVRQVIEEAGSAGLEVEIAGNGTAREQAPAPGTMVPPGTKIVVRCAR